MSIMRFTRRLMAMLLTLTLLVGIGAGCTRNTARATLGALRVASAVAEVVAVAAILAHHDDHYHGRACGHRYRYYDGRYNYWYNGHWEYYDAETTVWYSY